MAENLILFVNSASGRLDHVFFCIFGRASGPKVAKSFNEVEQILGSDILAKSCPPWGMNRVNKGYSLKTEKKYWIQHMCALLCYAQTFLREFIWFSESFTELKKLSFKDSFCSCVSAVRYVQGIFYEVNDCFVDPNHLPQFSFEINDPSFT